MNPNPPEESELATLLRASIIFEKRQREIDKKGQHKPSVLQAMAPDEYFDERGQLRRDRGYGKKGEVE